MRRLPTLLAPVLFLAAASTGSAGELDKAGPLEKRWYAARDLLAALAERDGFQWAMPETLAGMSLSGGDGLSAKAALDDACKQWNLAWTQSSGIVVVHRADDAKLKEWTDALKAGGAKAAEAAWELGWLRDARALPALAEALETKGSDPLAVKGSDPFVSLAAAQAVEVLDRLSPLGRTDRVDPIPTGRVALAAAFPPKNDLAALLDSPYPPVRAAAARLMLGAGGATAEAAKAKTAADKGFLVEQVRQQLIAPAPAVVAPGKEPPKPKGEQLPSLPATAEDVKAACRKMIDEIPGLEKQSEWEQMRRRARIIASWARAGSEPATEAILELSQTRAQAGWYPEYVMKYMADVGDAKVVARVKEAFARGGRDTMVRGLERVRWGDALLEFAKPYLAEQTIDYVCARMAGREALDELIAQAGKDNPAAMSSGPGGSGPSSFAALDALGAVGGPKAVAVLAAALKRDGKNSAHLAFRSAKALGAAGSSEALAALLAAADDPGRTRRHAAVLFLGRIGGPEAVKKLVEVLGKETDRMIRAAAADALEQIGTKEAAEAAAAFRKADVGLPPLVYQPRNKRFGPEFPVNEWVNLKIGIQAWAAYGEMGWNYDAANRLFFRYGGCSGYTSELTAFDLGTEEFIQRRPNEEMAGWDQRRPPRGCSGGRTWDPFNKTAWIGPAIGGSEADVAIAEYYNRDGGFGLCSYDLATDRFRPAAQAPNCQRYVFDWKHGLMMPVVFTHPNHVTKDWKVFETAKADPYSKEAWKVKTDQAKPYPFSSAAIYTNAGVHQESGLLVLYVPPRKEGPAETWTYDPDANIWKNMQPKETPAGISGGGLVYEPFQKVMILQSGKTVSQYGGPGDSITWAYDLQANTWTDLAPKNGPGNPWVGAMDFDPEHNAIVLFHFRENLVYAYRYKQVPAGTKAP
jgi:hypothetical protein